MHPLTTQGVTYLIQRGEAMMALFYIWVLYCALRAVAAKRRWPWTVGAIGCSILALSCKAIAVTSPVMVFLIDWALVYGSVRQTLRQRKWLYGGLIATWSMIAVVGLLVLFDPGSKLTAGFGYTGHTWWQYALTQPEVVLHYLKVSLWPFELCLDYHWPIQKSIGLIGLAVAAILLLIAATVWALKRSPLRGVCGAWFFVVLAPTSSFMPIKDVAFEHRMYLPLVGVVLLVVLGGYAGLRALASRFELAPQNARLGAIGAVGLVAIVLAYLAYQRNQDYHSTITMWQNVVRQRPDNYRAQHNLGRYLMRSGNHEQARVHLERAHELNPYVTNVQINAGKINFILGNLDKAKMHFERAAQLDAKEPLAHNNLGAIYYKRKKPKQAIKHFRQAVRINPNYVDAHYNLGLSYTWIGNRQAAIRHLRKVIRLAPQHKAAYSHLGENLEKQGKWPQAIATYRQWLSVDPHNRQARHKLQRALRRVIKRNHVK